MRTIYLDMDGVVADFQIVADNLLGREVRWGQSDITDEEWKFLATVPNLYYNLPELDGATDLFNHAKSFRLPVKFLTAIPRATSIPEAKDDKIRWINDRFPGTDVLFGPYSKNKWKHAKFLDILVDDRPSNIVEWKSKGKGIAIHHTNDFEKTKRLLTEAVNNVNTPLILGGI